MHSANAPQSSRSIVGSDPWGEGFDAGQDGRPKSDNPYASSDERAYDISDWNFGWHAGAEAAAKAKRALGEIPTWSTADLQAAVASVNPNGRYAAHRAAADAELVRRLGPRCHACDGRGYIPFDADCNSHDCRNCGGRGYGPEDAD